MTLLGTIRCCVVFLNGPGGAAAMSSHTGKTRPDDDHIELRCHMDVRTPHIDRKPKSSMNC